jgi:hypothetical protein
LGTIWALISGGLIKNEHDEIFDLQDELENDYAVLDMDEEELVDTFPDEYCDPMAEYRMA